MMRIRNGKQIVILSLLIFVLCRDVLGQMPARDIPGGAEVKIAAAIARTALRFEANAGQTDEQVRFLARGADYTLFLTSSDAVLSLGAGRPNSGARTSLGWRLAGANPNARIEALEKLPGKVSYYIGSEPREWRTNILTYGKVRYDDIYPNVDLVYYGNQGSVEYDFVLKPGADPGKIRLLFDGPDSAHIADNGDLVLRIGEIEVRLRKPTLYQEVDGVRRPVAGGYTQIRDKTGGASQIGFQIAKYDVTKPLIIDPVLDYSTYLGGLGDDVGRGVALDGGGYVYVAGSTTNAADFPGPAKQGGKAKKLDPVVPDSLLNAFSYVVKVDAKTGALFSSVYFNGTARGVAVSPGGKVHVVGQAEGGDFPFTPNAYSKAIGNRDAFVLTLAPDQDGMLQLNYATYLGGLLDDVAYGVSVGPDGNIINVTGTTYSDPGKFTLKNAFQNQLAGGADGVNRDAFVARLDTSIVSPPTDTLIYASYLGGTNTEDGFAITGAGTVEDVVTGQTCSTVAGGTFPTTPDGFQTQDHGKCDAFLSVVTFENGKSKLTYSTYIGGGDWDLAHGISTAQNGYVITGETKSADFPTTNSKDLPNVKDAYQPSNAGGYDAFVIVLSPGSKPQPCSIPKVQGLQYTNCADLKYSTYLGGAADDSGLSVAGKPTGINNLDYGIFVTGRTCSSPNPADCDAFVTRLDPTGKVVYSTSLGGSQEDFGTGIAVDPFGTIWVTGATGSTNFPKGLKNATQPNYGGGSHDAFLARITKTCTNGGGPYAYLLPFVFDTTSDCVVGFIPEADPMGDYLMAVSPDATRVYMINGTKTLHVIELDSTGKNATKVTKMPILGMGGLEGQGIALSPDGKKLYATDHHDNAPNFYVIDTDTLSVQNITFLPNTNTVAGGVVVHPDGQRFFVASYHGGKALVFNTSDNSLAKVIDIGLNNPSMGRPFGVAVTPDGHWVYIANVGEPVVSVIDASTPGMESWTGQNFGAGSPQSMAITPKKIPPYEYLAYTSGAVINTANGGTPVNGKVSGNFAAITPDGKVYFAQGETAAVYDVATDKPSDPLALPGYYANPVFGSFIGPQDRNGNGIIDEIDKNPNDPLNKDFEDPADPTQTGTIKDLANFQKVAVWKRFPKGFFARAVGTSANPAWINGCKSDVYLYNQTEVKFFCQSLDLAVISGLAKVSLGPGFFAKITAGGVVKVADGFHVQNLGPTTITIVDSMDTTIGSILPGQSGITPQVSCYFQKPLVYDGQPHDATCAATNNGATVSGTFIFAYSPGGTAPLNAGNYSLTANFTSTDPKYTNATATLSFTITRVPLTVTAVNASKLFGAPNPAFSATYSGFVSGENEKLLGGALIFTTAASDSSPVGTYPVTPAGLTSPNYAITFTAGTLSITYNVCLLYDPAQPAKSGATIPIKVQLCSANRANQSSPSIPVMALQVTNLASNVSTTPSDAGNSNPNRNFRLDGLTYTYNLKTDGLPPGSYNLTFAATKDPLPHAVPFQVR